MPSTAPADTVRSSSQARADTRTMVQHTIRHGLQSIPSRTVAVGVTSGVDAGARAVGTEVTIGTAEGSTLRITDPAVSRFHCDLRPAPGGVAVGDHTSTNGTFAGAVRIERGIVP